VLEVREMFAVIMKVKMKLTREIQIDLGLM